MRIGIDMSQVVYEGTGVSRYLENLLRELIVIDKKNEYVLFFSSFRRKFPLSHFNFADHKNVTIKLFKIPPLLLDLLWNRLHICPIEWFIGDVDVFISSDWTQPPAKKAKKATILYDLIVYKHPQETDKKILETQKRRLYWVAKECDSILCISESTKNDAEALLSINKKKLQVIYPGI